VIMDESVDMIEAEEESKKEWISDGVGKVILAISIIILVLMWGFVGFVIYNFSSYNHGSPIPGGTLCLDAMSQLSIVEDGQTCEGDGYVSIKIKGNLGGLGLKDIQILISNSGDVTSYHLVSDFYLDSSLTENATEEDLPKDDEEKVFYVEGYLDEEFNRIEIAPVVNVGATWKQCEISSRIDNVRNCNE